MQQTRQQTTKKVTQAQKTMEKEGGELIVHKVNKSWQSIPSSEKNLIIWKQTTNQI